jgi:hypothetical protein
MRSNGADLGDYLTWVNSKGRPTVLYLEYI